jgi:type I restriction enzyme M protein
MGFLVSAIEYLKEEHGDAFFDKDFQKFFREEMINGIELDPSMIRIGAMNLMLHGLESPNLIQNDSLSEGVGHIKDKYSLVLANPPFKGMIDHDAVDNSITSIVKSKKSELLFLAMMLRTLTIGGRAAVIVPDGVLFGSSKAHKTIRQEIIDNHQLQGIISMPSGVFKPYAGVSTAIMLFTKTNSGGTDHVWFYDMKSDGYSLDDKQNLLGATNDAGETIQKHEENNLPDIISKWNIFEALASSDPKRYVSEIKKAKRTDQSFFVPVSEIRENDYDLSINRYKEIVYEKVEYNKPEVILSKIAALDTERQTLIDSLENLLKP